MSLDPDVSKESAITANLVIPRWVHTNFNVCSLYCKKHNCGPLDVWNDCDECLQETPERFLIDPRYDRKTRELSADELSQACLLYNERIESLPHEWIPIKSILKKIPRDAAKSWLATFEVVNAEREAARG